MAKETNLGKPFTIRLPDRMKGDLQKLAKKDRRKLGDYIRKVLHDHLDQPAVQSKLLNTTQDLAYETWESKGPRLLAGRGRNTLIRQLKRRTRGRRKRRN